MRRSASYPVTDPVLFKARLLEWCGQFSVSCILDSNQWNGNKNDLIAAVGSASELAPEKNSFEELRKFHAGKKDWLFGYLSYDLKNETEKLRSENFDGLGFPHMHFFQPEYVFILRGDELEIQYPAGAFSEKEIEGVFSEITRGERSDQDHTPDKEHSSKTIRARIEKKGYVETIHNIKQHIHRGDIYEMNYCMEFFSEDTALDPAETFLRLGKISQTPFSAFYRLYDKYLLCASPERYLKKEGKKIISQPIKGTSKRGRNAYEDAQAAVLLSQSEKERSENVMIVDLVRNDLSKTCDQVKVEELFGVHTFKQWHQMVSTVSGELREGVDFTEVLKSTFPMGSMTGAPKVRAMELIEKYEKTKRGLYSGAVGYITPEADFDFNVVIRSILYNSSSKYLSFQAGSAITASSVPENEYEECLLKAKGMFEALRSNNDQQDHVRHDPTSQRVHA